MEYRSPWFRILTIPFRRGEIMAWRSQVDCAMVTTGNSAPPSLEIRKAFFFDIDGTLVDSNSAHALSWQRAFELVTARHYPYARIRRLIGMPGNALIPTVSDLQENSPEGQKVSRTHSEIFLKKHLSTIKVFPQARELVHTLQSAGVKTAAATSLRRGEMEKILHQAQLLGSFDLAVCIDDLEEAPTKRNTIAFALEKLQLSAKEVYYVADTPHDIEAASSVGVQTIALRCGGWDDDGLARAYRIYDDPADLLREVQSRLPAAKTAA